jgi:hypothetical protein
MNAPVFHVIALANALLLALPAGWCNSFGQLDRHAAASVQTVCCHLTSNHPESSLPRPSVPVVQCCCSQAVVAPEKVVTQADQAPRALPVFLTDFGSAEGESTFATPIAAPFSATLRLHALLCVWRC